MKKMYKLIASAVFICSLVFPANVNAQWSAMGSGLGGPGANAMIGFKGNLFIGGGFFTPYSDITIWNGSTYSSAGFSPSQPPLAFASFDSVLYIATYNAIYQRIAASTVQIATLNDPCYALCFWNHKLYAGGWMNTINSVKLGYLDQYDPSTSTWDSIPVEVDSWPKAMCVYNGQLAVGGYMNYSSAKDTLYGVGLWNGTKWTPLNKGIKGSGGVYAMTVLNTDLYIGGQFDSASTTYKYGPHVYAHNIAMWNGTTWDSVGAKGTSSTIYAMTTFNNAVVAGGFFDSVMSWSGSAWSSLGALTYTGGAEVNAMTVMAGNLYIGGSIASAGGTPVNYVAEYTIPTAVNELVSGSGDIKLYPNPNNGNFAVNVTGKSQIEVYNILGEKVFNTQLNSGINQVNMAGQSAGVYVYRILSQDGSFIASGKMIKQ